MRHALKTALISGLLCGLQWATPALAQEKLRIAGNFASDHSSSIAMQLFKKEVETASKGGVIIEVFDNMQLGGAQENVTPARRRCPGARRSRNWNRRRFSG